MILAVLNSLVKITTHTLLNRLGKWSDDCSGMTIVEVLVSLTLVMILLGGIYAGVVQGITANHAAAQRISAFGLCKDLLETMRGAPYHSITTDNYGPTTVEIARLGPGNSIEGIRTAEITPFFPPARKQVTVRLQWTYRNQVFNEFATGIIYSRNRGERGSAGGALGGHVRLNPNNSPNNHFYLVMADGTVISRANLLARHSGISGYAQEVRFQPMGSGSQNTLTVNDEPFEMDNSRRYIIEGTEGGPLYVTLENNGPGAMGHWTLRITSEDGRITVQ